MAGYRCLLALGFVAVLGIGHIASAQGVPVTNVPMIQNDFPDPRLLGNGTGGAANNSIPTDVPPPEPSRRELEISYMTAVGSGAYMKQACGNNSWRDDLEHAKTKIQPENMVAAIRAFRSGWDDTSKRFGADIRVCDKVATLGQATNKSAAQTATTDQKSSLGDMLSGIKAPDMGNAAKSAIGTNNLQIQPTTIKPE